MPSRVLGLAAGGAEVKLSNVIIGGVNEWPLGHAT
jgi:hypothetical protein